MNTIQTSLYALMAVMILTLSMSLIAGQTGEEISGSTEMEREELGSETGNVDNTADTSSTFDIDKSAEAELIPASSRKPANRVTDDAATLAESTEVPGGGQDKPPREKVWSDINEAITGLNDMVGDNMFRRLVRKNSTSMEVRVDLEFWQRVRYETRVDLKNDISNIWHLYVRQYNENNESSVFFVDDITGKTIDIFTQRRREE